MAPAGMRLVGVGDLVVPVPEGWSTDGAHCAQPIEDTVVNPVGASCAMLVQRPADITTVELSDGRYGQDPTAGGAGGPDPGRDGLHRSPVTCEEYEVWRGPGALETLPLCSATVSDATGSSALVSSSMRDVDASRAAVEQLVAGARPRHAEEAVVPTLEIVYGADQGDRARTYLENLRAAGLAPELVEERVVPTTGGELLGASVEPGSVLRRGSSVQVEVAAAPRGPAETVEITGRYTRPAGSPTGELVDATVRQGAAIRLRVGDLLVVDQVDGDARGTPQGDGVVVEAHLDGGAARRVTEGTWAGAFEAVGLGSSTVTLTASGGGTTQAIGTITIEVVG
ncbi:hypothetical protein INN71_04205 [Nocardioides sp. ChNu-153]|uniref:hypothetical protein n=1 Tax=unclassified Nocardioides TaxID=2615069 RepID=UPI002407053C|nr:MULTISPECIES: hypothetical protein [unclassified Nocardioides]MDF9715427.1 hypothetical protein [Nocardioides sp. ChNu-99]MDN7120590.1 hypothetical protein [Nocardioides sp. ChNu-153]